MPFKRNNTDVQRRKDRGSESEGKRRRSSHENKPWTPKEEPKEVEMLGMAAVVTKSSPLTASI